MIPENGKLYVIVKWKANLNTFPNLKKHLMKLKLRTTGQDMNRHWIRKIIQLLCGRYFKGVYY